MKVLLQQDDKKLGKKGTIVTVSDGYAQSALIPQGKAIPATPTMIAKQQQLQKEEQNRQQAEILRAKKTAKLLKNKTLVISRPGKNGKLFGSVTTTDIAQAIKQEYTVDIAEHAVDINHIKHTGHYDITITLGHDIHAKMLLEVQEE